MKGIGREADFSTPLRSGRNDNSFGANGIERDSEENDGRHLYLCFVRY
jgi:hypothetical protein